MQLQLMQNRCTAIWPRSTTRMSVRTPTPRRAQFAPGRPGALELSSAYEGMRHGSLGVAIAPQQQCGLVYPFAASQSHESPPACSGAFLPPQETSTPPHYSRPKDDEDASVSSRSVNWGIAGIGRGGLQPWINVRYASIQAGAVMGLLFVEGDSGDYLVSDQVVSAGAGLGEVATATADCSVLISSISFIRRAACHGGCH